METIQRNTRESIELREQQLNNLVMENRNIRALHDRSVAELTNAEQHRDQLRQELARLVAVCEVLLQESPATWGPAHLALRDHLAHLRRPPANG